MNFDNTDLAIIVIGLIAGVTGGILSANGNIGEGMTLLTGAVTAIAGLAGKPKTHL